MLDNRAKYVNSLLLAHLTLSTLAVVLTTAGFLATSIDGSTGVLTSGVVMVLVGYILLGVAPQTLGRQNPERISLALAGVTRLLAVFFGPLTRLFIIVGNAITPGRGFREGPFSTQAELRELVDMAGADSVIEDDERQMIHSVFELGDTVAREVMVPRTEMVWIERTKTLRQAMSLSLRSGYSRIPVIGESVDDVVGVIYMKDVARRIFEHSDAQSTERVEEHMRDAFMVPDSKSVDELLRDMQSARTHLAVLVDEYGGTAGLVTIEDVLEEIVGDISDEYDVAPPEVEELSEGRYRISARMHIDDFAALIGIELSEEDSDVVDTVGGLMAKHLGIVPLAGAVVRLKDFVLTAEAPAGRRHRITAVLVEPDNFAGQDTDD
jgi:CBS domain containing-hemolysin-like protein